MLTTWTAVLGIAIEIPSRECVPAHLFIVNFDCWVGDCVVRFGFPPIPLVQLILS